MATGPDHSGRPTQRGPDHWLDADDQAPAARALRVRPLVWLGGISYGFYLFHLPVMELTAKFVPGPWATHIALGLTVSLLIAAASYRFVERPFLRRKDRPQPAQARLQPPLGVQLNEA